MKLLRRFTGSHAVFAAAVLLGFAASANAQVEAYRGSFTVTNQLHWGKATLEPGNYTLEVGSGGTPMVTIRRKDGKGEGLVASLGVSQYKGADETALLVAIAGNERTVYSLRLPEQGIELTFQPELKREMQRAEQARNQEAMPVLEAKR
jgi:hypothetical protein